MASIKKPIKKAQNGIVSPSIRAAAMARREENIRKRDSVLNRNAAARGMTREQVREKQYKERNTPDQQVEGLNIAGANKRGASKGSCTTGVKNQGESLRDTKRNGGKVAKDGKWIQKAINPKHKGFCTPQTKATCTPKRKALAQTLRKIAKKKK
jgi:hypothetical protein